MSEIDWNQFREEFEAEWQESEPAQEEAVVEPVADETVEEVEEATTEELVSSEEETDTEDIEYGSDSDESDSEPVEDAPQLAGEPSRQKRKQTPEENQHFAKMRHQLKEMEQYRQVIEAVAAQNGVPAELLIQRFNEQQLQKKAEQEGLSLEKYREITETKERLNSLELQYRQREYQDQIRDVQIRYGIKEDNDPKIQRAYEYIRRNGLYDPNTYVPYVKFEDIFKVANHDALVEEAAKKAKQEQLAAKRQRQQQAAPVAHTGGSVQTQEKDFMSMSSEEFEAFMKARGVSLDY